MIYNPNNSEASSFGTSWTGGSRHHRTRQGQCCLAQGSALPFEENAALETAVAACRRQTPLERLGILASRRMAESA